MNEIQNASKQYMVRTLVLMGIYSAINIAAIFGLFDNLHGASASILALAVSVPVIGQMWAALVLMRDSDEFVRGLLAKRFIAAAGITMAFFTSWGFMEVYASAPHAPNCIIFGIFWGSFGIVSLFIQTTRS
jgi:hypothetical protein